MEPYKDYLAKNLSNTRTKVSTHHQNEKRSPYFGKEESPLTN